MLYKRKEIGNKIEKKTQIILDYNEIKDSVDTIDRKLVNCASKRKTMG